MFDGSQTYCPDCSGTLRLGVCPFCRSALPQTPEVPDLVPYFIQGRHLTPGKQRGAQTRVRCRGGQAFLVSSVQLPDGTFETRVFTDGGKGPAWREPILRNSVISVAEEAHGQLCSVLHAWKGPDSGEPPRW